MTPAKYGTAGGRPWEGLPELERRAGQGRAQSRRAWSGGRGRVTWGVSHRGVSHRACHIGACHMGRITSGRVTWGVSHRGVSHGASHMGRITKACDMDMDMVMVTWGARHMSVAPSDHMGLSAEKASRPAILAFCIASCAATDCRLVSSCSDSLSASDGCSGGR
eukprot:437838-Prymnesium_polylepis.1